MVVRRTDAEAGKAFQKATAIGEGAKSEVIRVPGFVHDLHSQFLSDWPLLRETCQYHSRPFALPMVLSGVSVLSETQQRIPRSRKLARTR